MTQYSERMVIVHWLTLALVVAALLAGGAIHFARQDGSATIGCYLGHMLAGVTVLLLTLARLAFRGVDGVPPPGDTPADKVAKIIQHLLYALLILLPLSGSMLVLTSDVGTAISAGDAALLPKSLDDVMAHGIHRALVIALVLLVAVHILGALKHQFVMKDNIMSRLSLRRK